jgi:hypothetical protein
MAAAAVVSWFIRLESRLNAMLSFEDHQRICEKNHSDTKESLAEIKTLAMDAGKERFKISEELTEVKIKLAVLISQSGKDI